MIPITVFSSPPGRPILHPVRRSWAPLLCTLTGCLTVDGLVGPARRAADEVESRAAGLASERAQLEALLSDVDGYRARRRVELATALGDARLPAVSVLPLDDREGRLDPRERAAVAEHLGAVLAGDGAVHVRPSLATRARIRAYKRNRLERCPTDDCDVSIGEARVPTHAVALELSSAPGAEAETSQGDLLRCRLLLRVVELSTETVSWSRSVACGCRLRAVLDGGEELTRSLGRAPPW